MTTGKVVRALAGLSGFERREAGRHRWILLSQKN